MVKHHLDPEELRFFFLTAEKEKDEQTYVYFSDGEFPESLHFRGWCHLSSDAGGSWPCFWVGGLPCVAGPGNSVTAESVIPWGPTSPLALPRWDRWLKKFRDLPKVSHQEPGQLGLLIIFNWWFLSLLQVPLWCCYTWGLHGAVEGKGAGSVTFPTAPGAAWAWANFLFLFWVLRKQTGHFGLYSLPLCGLPGSIMEGISASLHFDGLCE